MVRNATKLYYPIKPSIESILPIVDEFIVALGNCDENDHTEQEIRSIASDKIKIIRTVWDLEKFPNGMEYARQTDIAKESARGDWLFYIQSDEVVHEKYLPLIRQKCEQFLDDKDVEGFLFHYRHFWGDYDHYVLSHALYPKEMRIIRNDKEIHSWRDAQSFRRIPVFDGKDYYQKRGSQKLRVFPINAWIYHYGFVRPPHLMQQKRKTQNTNYQGMTSTDKKFKDAHAAFDYGNLNKIEKFNESHPVVMNEFLKKFNWKNRLRYSGGPCIPPLKHERFKYRVITWIEQNFFSGRQLFGFKNYILRK